MDIFRIGGAQPHSIAFWGVFPNITAAIPGLEFTPQKWSLDTKIDELSYRGLGKMSIALWPSFNDGFRKEGSLMSESEPSGGEDYKSKERGVKFVTGTGVTQPFEALFPEAVTPKGGQEQ